MARFRSHPDTEALLRDIVAVDDTDRGERLYRDVSAGITDWLAGQQVGQLLITSPAPLLVDIEAPSLLDQLDKHPRVRATLDTSGLGTPWTRLISTRASSGSADLSAGRSRKPSRAPCTTGSRVPTASATGLASTRANGAGRSTTTYR